MDDGTGGRDLTELLKEVCEQLEPVFAYGGSLTLMNMLNRLDCYMSLIMLARLNTFCCLRKLSNVMVLTCLSLAVDNHVSVGYRLLCICILIHPIGK